MILKVPKYLSSQYCNELNLIKYFSSFYLLNYIKKIYKVSKKIYYNINNREIIISEKDEVPS